MAVILRDVGRRLAEHQVLVRGPTFTRATEPSPFGVTVAGACITVW